jgi:hypothetical protein
MFLETILEDSLIELVAIRVVISTNVVVLSLLLELFIPLSIVRCRFVLFVLFLDDLKFLLLILGSNSSMNFHQSDSSFDGPLICQEFISITLTLNVSLDSDMLHRAPEEVNQIVNHMPVMSMDVIELLQRLSIFLCFKVRMTTMPFEPHLCHFMNVEFFLLHIP